MGGALSYSKVLSLVVFLEKILTRPPLTCSFLLLFQVTGVVFVSAAATVVTLDCVSPWENCDTWWLMFCLCLTATAAATLVVVVGMWCSSLLWAG
ncbi:unnamed protein product [Prunus armeniaca]